MKKLALTALAFSAISCSAFAAKGFNAAFWAPDMQVVPPSEDISGVRLNIYGENRNVKGVDFGTGNSVTGDMTGLQFCIFLPPCYNHVGGKLNGAQFAVVNQYGREVNGATFGFVNYSTAASTEVSGAQFGAVTWGSKTEIWGAQLGFVNKAKSVTGAQLGFVNFTDKLKGVQLGLWNMVLDRSWGDIGNRGLGRGFPFINLGW